MATSMPTDSMEGLFEGFEPYKLDGVTITDEELGSGAYASVLKMDYMGLKCAGKKIHTALLGKDTATSYTVRKFRDECQLLSQVRHPNIVQFLGVHFELGEHIPILVMEFLSFNLTQCVSNHHLQSEICYSILHDVAVALNYLHGQMPPIVHRDLTSNNVLLTSNMMAKISDLGVARILELSPQATQLTQTPGTPAFMPPEVMVAQPSYNTSVDIFSYGAMMIHILSGKWPEPQLGPTRTEGERLIPVSEIERREELLQEIGNDHPLIGLILKCINNNPEMRATAVEIVKRLADMVELLPNDFTNQLHMIDYIKKLEKANMVLKQENTEIKLSHNMTMIQQRKIISRLEKKQRDNYREMKGLIDSLKPSLTKRSEKGRFRSASLGFEEQKQECDLDLTHQEIDSSLQRETPSPTHLPNQGRSYHVSSPTYKMVTESDTPKHSRSASDTLHPLLVHSLRRPTKQGTGGESPDVNLSPKQSYLQPDTEEPGSESRENDENSRVMPTSRRAENISSVSGKSRPDTKTPTGEVLHEWNMTGHALTLVATTYSKSSHTRSSSANNEERSSNLDSLKRETKSTKSRLSSKKSASFDSATDSRSKHSQENSEKGRNNTTSGNGNRGANGFATTTKAKRAKPTSPKKDGRVKPSLHKQRSVPGAFKYPLDDQSLGQGQSNAEEVVNHSSTSDDLTYPIYTANSDYEARSSSELSFKRGDQMHIKGEGAGEMWLGRVTTTAGKDGYIPKSHVTALQDEKWFFGKLDASTANRLIMTSSNQVGSFLVRQNKKTGIFSLTVRDHNKARHYHIHKQEDGTLFASQYCCFRSIHDLVLHHAIHEDGLFTKLGEPCVAPLCVQDYEEIIFKDKLSTGQFSEVWKGKWNEKVVAVNKMRMDSMTQVEILDVCALMKTLDHTHLIQLLAIYMKSEPFLVITEHMPNGSLRQYLPSVNTTVKLSELIKISAQVAAAMSYLENCSCIHQDLSAGNIMAEVQYDDINCKLCVCPYVHQVSGPDGIYSLDAAKAPVRCLPYKAIVDNQVSIKSNVWSFGIVLWEILSYCRTCPYPEMSELEVVERLQLGYRMPRPLCCPEEVYQLISNCWSEEANDRPTFQMIHSQLNELYVSNRFGYQQLESEV